MTATKTPAKKSPPKKVQAPKAKASKTGSTLPGVMRELESAGSEQTRKTYARHGVTEPMFGVSFATLKTLMKRIGVDHELALALWDTGNFDARNLAVKIVDPARMTSADLDRWAGESRARMCGSYVAMLAGETPHAMAKVKQWLDGPEGVRRCAGWALLGHMSSRDEQAPDTLFAKQLARIERTIHSAPNDEREAMNMAVVLIGCRNAELRKAALAAAKRIGKVEVDHGDTACKTPDASQSIAKAWKHSSSKGFESPAAHERSREQQRLRC